VTAFQGLCDSSEVVAPEFGICYIGMLMATVFIQVGYAVPYEGNLNDIPPLDEWEEPQWDELQDQLTEIRDLCQRMDCRSTSLTAREDISDGPWAKHSSFHDDFDNILEDCQLHAKVSKTRSELKVISHEFEQRTFDPHSLREKKLSHIVYVSLIMLVVFNTSGHLLTIPVLCFPATAPCWKNASDNSHK